MVSRNDHLYVYSNWLKGRQTGSLQCREGPRRLVRCFQVGVERDGWVARAGIDGWRPPRHRAIKPWAQPHRRTRNHEASSPWGCRYVSSRPSRPEREGRRTKWVPGLSVQHIRVLFVFICVSGHEKKQTFYLCTAPLHCPSLCVCKLRNRKPKKNLKTCPVFNIIFLFRLLPRCWMLY